MPVLQCFQCFSHFVLLDDRMEVDAIALDFTSDLLLVNRFQHILYEETILCTCLWELSARLDSWSSLLLYLDIS
jgi:hypothetical protein